MEGMHGPALRQALGIPPRFEVALVIPTGYGEHGDHDGDGDLDGDLDGDRRSMHSDVDLNAEIAPDPSNGTGRSVGPELDEQTNKEDPGASQCSGGGTAPFSGSGSDTQHTWTPSPRYEFPSVVSFDRFEFDDVETT